MGSAPQRLSSLGLEQLGLGWGPAALGQTPPHPDIPSPMGEAFMEVMLTPQDLTG